MHHVTPRFFKRWNLVFVLAFFSLCHHASYGAACSPPTITAVAGSDTICAGSSANLTLSSNPQNDSNNCNGSYFGYTWYNGTSYWDGSAFTLSTASLNTSYYNIVLTSPPTTTTTYTVYVQCVGNPSCVSSSAVTVTVVPQPTASPITPGIPAGSICAGQAVSATFTGGSGGAGAVTDVYEYSINSGSSFSAYIPGTSISTTGLAGQSVIIGSSRTATGTGCSTSSFNTVTWVVDAQPTSSPITPGIPEGNICAGQAVSATFTGGSGGAGTVTDVYEYSTNSGTSYSAYTGGTNIATAALAGQSVIINSTRTATGAGCSTSSPNIVTWVVDAQPTASPITPNVAAGNICVGQAVSATFSGGSGGTGTVTDVYQYSTNSGSTYSTYAPGTSIPTTGLTGESVIIRSSRTATGSGCTTSSYNTVTWVVNAQPSASSITPNIAAGNVCAGQGLSATFSGGSGGAGTVTDVYEYSTNSGTSYSSYTPGNSIATGGIAGQTVIIRSSRTATGADCSTSGYNMVTWTVLPQQVAPTIDPSIAAGNICAGQDVSATFSGGSGGGGSATDVYQYSTNSGSTYNTYTAGSSITTDAVAGMSVIIEAGRTGSGSGCSTVYNTVTWNVDAQPTASPITPNVAAGTICAGQGVSATFTGGSGGAGTVTDVYEYSTNGGTSFSAYTPGTSISTTGLTGQTVIIRSSRTATGAGCTTSSYNTVSWMVTSLITPSVTINVSPGDTICSGATLTFTATPTNGGNSPAYQWQNNSVNVGTNSDTYTASNFSNSDVVAVIMTSDASCVSTSMATSNGITVTVEPAPSVSLSGGNDTVCTGATVTLTSTLTGGVGTPDYEWETSTSQGGTYTEASGSTTGSDYSPPTDSTGVNWYTLALTYPTSTGCTVTPPAGLSVTVNAQPSVSVSAADSSLCVNNSDLLTAVTSGGAGVLSYNWQQSSNGGSYTSVSSSGLTYATPVSLNPGDYSYKMVLSASDQGCNSATSNTVSVQILSPPAKPLFTPEADTVCVGTQGANFTTDSVISVDTYLWTSPGQQIGAANQPDAAISFDNVGVYDVILTVTEDGGCYNTDTVPIVVTNTQAPNPAKPIYYAGTLVLLDTGYNYQWGFDKAPYWSPVVLAGETFQDYALPVPIDTTNYHYWVIVSDGSCFSKIYFNGGLETGINSASSQNKFRVYPDPVENMLVVQLSTEVKNALNIYIYDLYGREVMKFNNAGNGQEALLNLSDLASSIYVLTVFDGNEPVGNMKFVKE